MKRWTIIFWVATIFLFCADPAVPQTTWFKYEGNPVLDVGPRGSWDDKAADIFQVMRENDVYRAWYSGNDGTHRRLGYATSRDGITWAKHPRPVIDLGADGTWDWREAATGHVVHLGSKYIMWYHGYDGSLWRIGYAESNDGVVWKKAYDANPVLTGGAFAWDVLGVGFPSVMRDARSGFKMWYSGYSEGIRVQIGYASGKDAKTWARYSSPALGTGAPGSWDDKVLLFPNVLANGALYEMWYAGSRGVYTTSRIGYATSPDGIQWTKGPSNPILKPGPSGSWDAMATLVGEVLLEGNLYRMWYVGFDGVIGRSGYAVSPRGTEVNVPDDSMYVTAGKDSVFISVRVHDPSALSFSAEIESPDGHPVDTIELLDDGAHGDSSAGDGIFANLWLPKEERHYSVDLKLRLPGKNDLTFELNNAASFTSIGPIKLDQIVIINNVAPNPGDTVLIKLALRNHGSSVRADSVSALISTADKWITDLTSASAVSGVLSPGAVALTDGSYRFSVSPNCPLGTDIPFDIQISSAGIPRWQDTFVISVLPPWWRSNWAYALYAVVVVGIFLGLRKIEVRRLRLKHQREMEHFQLDKLKEVDQLKSRFFANISHEFRTPLTLIQGPIRKLLSEETRERVKEEYRMVLRNSRRLQHLVNQLLDLSKFESGQVKLCARQTNIVEIARGISASFESLAKRNGIEFTVAFFEKPIVGWFDRDAVEKIMTNLLSNAFKFTPEGGEVVVSIHLRARDDSVKITVSDTGIGIAQDQLPKIFDRFYQVDGSQTREQEGTGIGLALTKELVELHNGKITATSEPGKGSTFTVSLRLGKEHLREDEIDVGESTPRVATRPTLEIEERKAFEPEHKDIESAEARPLLLIIEDNADMRKYVRTHLEDRYRLSEAVDGEEGVQKAIETIPDLVISDIMMPKKDGLEVCKTLKADEKTCHIPVILLTARAEMDSKLEGLERGADDYLVKPFDAKEVLVRVRNLVEQRRKLRKQFSIAQPLRPGEIAITSKDDAFLQKVKATLEAHMGDENLTVEDLAKEVAMSRSQLHRKLTALTGLSPTDFIRYMRLHRAMDLLRQNAATVAEIAYRVGFGSVAYFTKAFKHQFGIVPSKARQITS